MSTQQLARTEGDDKKTIMPNVRAYYGQLIGATVSDVVLCKQAEEDWTQDDYTPVIVLTTADGNLLYVEVWTDPEGNGAGHLEIAKIGKES